MPNRNREPLFEPITGEAILAARDAREITSEEVLRALDRIFEGQDEGYEDGDESNNPVVIKEGDALERIIDKFGISEE